MALLASIFLFAAVYMTCKMAYVIVQYEHLMDPPSIDIGCTMTALCWVSWVGSMGWFTG